MRGYKVPRTCIICGGPTGSREHIFPAALGGRRTNKGIYCGDDNNAYSGLARIISEQLAVFNAMLGVVGDHSDLPTSVTMRDLASGHDIELSSGKVQLRGPHIHSEKTQDGQVVTAVTFNTKEEAEEWKSKLRARGVEVQFVDEGGQDRYHLGTAHKRITLGGTEEGLRSIGYIAQTFFAHSFPDIARQPELQAIKEYTLHNKGSEFVWWDFEPPSDLPSNSFPFGHRVIVGLDADAGTAYARISFFSALNFAVSLATLRVEASRAVITDIDPLANSPPHDIVSRIEDNAIGAVRMPDNLTASLRNAIETGRAQAEIEKLLKRIDHFDRDVAATRIMQQIASANSLPHAERADLFQRVVLEAGECRVLGYFSPADRLRS